MLIPNPEHGGFDRLNEDVHIGKAELDESLPVLSEPAAGRITGRVAKNPNAYDDIVDELNTGGFSEVILDVQPHHISHWLHVDLVDRVKQLGYPVQVVAAAE